MRPGRFLLAFAAAAAVLFGLLLAPPAQPLVSGFARLLVRIAAAAIHLFGGSALAQGDVLTTVSGTFAIAMKRGCDGVNVTILMWSAVIAFPTSWMRRGKGLLWGTAAIQILNFTRFVSLYYLGQYSQRWFEFAHLYLWESLIMLDALVVFGVWASRVLAANPAGHAAS